MVQLRQDYQEFVRRDSAIFAVNPEDRKTVAAFWNRENIPFPGICDPDHRIADQYGQVDSPATMGRAPAVFIIDRTGVIRYEHHGTSAADIPENAFILYLIDELNKER